VGETTEFWNHLALPDSYANLVPVPETVAVETPSFLSHEIT